MAIELGFEVTKELADQTYQLVEKAKSGGKIRKGVNEVTKSVERNEAKLVIIAADVNPADILLHLPIICKEKEIPIISVPAKEELGASAGLPVGTAAIAIADAGPGKTILSSITKSIGSLTGKPAKEEKAEE